MAGSGLLGAMGTASAPAVASGQQADGMVTSTATMVACGIVGDGVRTALNSSKSRKL